jgi:hypothetical protein
MQFHDFQDCVAVLRKAAKKQGLKRDISQEEVYEVIEEAGASTNNPFAYRQSILESDWSKHDKPYYNIWPAVFDMVGKVKLSIPCDAIRPPSHTICLRLPTHPNNPYVFDGCEVKTVLFGVQKVAEQAGSQNLIDGLTILFDIGETYGGFPCYTFKIFPLLPGVSLEDATETLASHNTWFLGKSIPDPIVQSVVKLVTTICLIYDDPNFVTPDILAKDRVIFDMSDDKKKQALIDKAKRRGKNGFNLGQSIEKIPHYRNAHYALFWTGPNRAKPIVKLRSGSVVHKSKITSVPTGYLDDH